MRGYQQILELFDTWDEREDAIPFGDLVASLRGLKLERADLAGALIFADRNYRRIAVRRRTHYEALVLCWKSGQRSPIHNHLGSSCVVRVVEGRATETQYIFSPCGKIVPQRSRTYSAGSVTGCRDEAIESYRRAIELDSGLGEPYNNLGVSLQSLGRMAEAMVCFRKAVELMPNGGAHHSNLLYSLNYDASYNPAQLFAEHRDWGRRYADPLTRRSEPHANDRAPDRRLRVGYVSANFRNQAVNFFSEPILASTSDVQRVRFRPCDIT